MNKYKVSQTYTTNKSEYTRHRKINVLTPDAALMKVRLAIRSMCEGNVSGAPKWGDFSVTKII